MQGETVYRLRAGTSTSNDRYGHPVPGTPQRTPIEKALVDPGGFAEPVEVGRQPVITVPTCYWLNQWPDIKASDQLEVRGEVFDVTGKPGDWRSAVGGLVVQLKRAEG